MCRITCKIILIFYRNIINTARFGYNISETLDLIGLLINKTSYKNFVLIEDFTHKLS